MFIADVRKGYMSQDGLKSSNCLLCLNSPFLMKGCICTCILYMEKLHPVTALLDGDVILQYDSVLMCVSKARVLSVTTI